MDVGWYLNKAIVRCIAGLLHARGLYKKYYDHWRVFFADFERHGLHVLPVDYNTPVPDTRTLSPMLWDENTEMVGIQVDDEKALALIRFFAENYKSEYEKWPVEEQGPEFHYFLNNNFYAGGDSEILYSMVRHFKPRRIIEIGSGFSTLVTAQAIGQNRHEDPSYSCEFVAVEPYPSEAVRRGVPGLTSLIEKTVQDVPLARFSVLDKNDILFIDSTHVLSIGSDVQYEFLEIVPRLAPGVIVHVHDIFLPGQYPKTWIYEKRFFWNEQYVLQAFLAFNEHYEVLCPTRYMYVNHPEEMKTALPRFGQEHLVPSSFWFRRAR